MRAQRGPTVSVESSQSRIPAPAAKTAGSAKWAINGATNPWANRMSLFRMTTMSSGRPRTTSFRENRKSFFGETMTSTPGKHSRVKATLASVLRLSTSRTGHGLPSSDAAATAVDRQS